MIDVKPTFALAKTVDLAERPEPNATFTYTLKITNTSVENVTITNITDDYPLSQECVDLIGQELLPQQIVSCQYAVTFAQPDTYDNNVRVDIQDNDGSTAFKTRQATVTVTRCARFDRGGQSSRNRPC